jgi:hypothetical protein
MELPDDGFILLSLINTKLRDCYPSLEALCEDMELDARELCSRLRGVGYEYDADHNKFI